MDTENPAPSPLQRLRESRGLTQKAVGAAVGRSAGQISRIERFGDTRGGTAARIRAFFGDDAITEEQILYPDRFRPAAE